MNDVDKYEIDSGWLVYNVGHHTCAGGGPEANGIHEPGCGYDGVLSLDQIHRHMEIVNSLRPLCRCTTYAADGSCGSQADCPIDGDGAAFVAYVVALEEENRRLRADLNDEASAGQQLLQRALRAEQDPW